MAASPTHGRYRPAEAVRSAPDHRLQRLGRLLAHEAAQLIDDGALRGILAEDEARDRDDDQQRRGH
jgi:hypothetical protein